MADNPTKVPSKLSSQSSSTEAPATPDAAAKSIKVKKMKGPQDGSDSDDDADGAVTITEATKQKLQAIADEDSSGGDSADPSAAMAVSKEKQLDDAFNTLERSMTQSVYFLPDGTAEWELLPWDVKVDDVVGEGAFGEIRCGRWRGSPVAIKTLKSDCMTDAIALKEFNCEMSIWCRLVHPNIVQFLGVGYKAGQPPIMVCELMGGGSLQQKLLELQSWGKKMDFDRAFKIASNIAAALNYMHSRRPYAVLPRDIKPDSGLIDDGWQAKIADLGCSREADLENTMEVAGTPMFMAPELLRRERYDEKVDVWSFACVLECLWTHDMVYASASLDEADGYRGLDAVIKAVEREVLRPRAGGFVAGLVQRCAEFDPDVRCSFADAVEELTGLASKAATVASNSSLSSMSSTDVHVLL